MNVQDNLQASPWNTRSLTCMNRKRELAKSFNYYMDIFCHWLICTNDIKSLFALCAFQQINKAIIDLAGMDISVVDHTFKSANLQSEALKCTLV